MKLYYYPETDSLYIELTPKPGTNVVQVSASVVIDFDNEGHPVGIDIDNASKIVDLTRLEAENLPLNAFTLV